MKPSSIARALTHAVNIRRPVFVWGPPGTGKSDVVANVAKTLDRELVDVRLNLLDPVDVKGFPVPDSESGVMRWLPADFLPPMYVKGKGSKMMPNESAGILFLDEFNSAPPATQAAGYQLILNHRIGNYVLPKNWSIIAAGNRQGDRGVTHKMPSPLANRLIHLDMDIDLDDWATWAVKNGVHNDVLGFARFRSNLLHKFDPAENPRAFPSPRSWMFVSELIKDNKLTPSEELEMIAGTVGEGAASEFRAYRESKAHLPNIDKILVDPDSVPVPSDDKPAVMFALSTELASRATSNNFDRIMRYVKRMPVEFQVVVVRDASRRDNSVSETDAFNKWAIANSNVLT